MIVFPNCKINLGLHILAKRADGYHDLETVFYPIPLKDILEIIPAPAAKKGTIEFTQSGLPIEGNITHNICVKAYQLIKELHQNVPGIKLHLHKQIPMGAGLGGGSSDAAFLLAALNDKFELGISHEQLSKMALQLGSDCPFFLLNKPCLAYGRGEKLEPISVNLSGWKIVLINPGIHISTADAFKDIHPQQAIPSLKDLIKLPPAAWKYQLVNQFEGTVFNQYPQLSKLKDALYAQGAVYASMSGSGSTLFGLFDGTVTLPTNFVNRYSFYREYLLP